MMRNKAYTDFPVWIYIFGFFMAVLLTVWITCFAFVKPQDNATPPQKEVHRKRDTLHSNNGREEEEQSRDMQTP